LVSANKFIGNTANVCGRMERCYWYCDHDLFGLECSQSLDGCKHARSRCDAVIDKDDDPALDRNAGPNATVQFLSPLQLNFLGCDRFCKLFFRDSDFGNYPTIENACASTGNRSHGEFPLARHTKLPDKKNIKRSVDRLGDLEGDWHSTSWNAQHYDVFAICVAGQPSG
jgi:hypothetical protein